jgi:hypothetical protein
VLLNLLLKKVEEIKIISFFLRFMTATTTTTTTVTITTTRNGCQCPCVCPPIWVIFKKTPGGPILENHGMPLSLQISLFFYRKWHAIIFKNRAPASIT